VNRQIHQITILVVVMFLALSASLTSVQGLARPALWQGSSSQGTLTTDSRNSRTVYAEFGTDRGQIMVGDTAVADSVKSDDAYSYQRTYPGGELYAPVTGYFSTVFASMTGLERAENTVLNGQDPSPDPAWPMSVPRPAAGRQPARPDSVNGSRGGRAV